MAKFWRKKKSDENKNTKPENVEVSESDIAEITLESVTETIAYHRLWKAGLAATATTVAANLFIYGAATAMGIPLVVPGESGTEMIQMPVGYVIITIAASAVGATLLLAFFGIPFFRGQLPRPTRILWGIAFFTWLFSLAGPLSLPVSNQSKAVMCLMHTTATVIIVATLTLFGRNKQRK